MYGLGLQVSEDVKWCMVCIGIVLDTNNHDDYIYIHLLRLLLGVSEFCECHWDDFAAWRSADFLRTSPASASFGRARRQRPQYSRGDLISHPSPVELCNGKALCFWSLKLMRPFDHWFQNTGWCKNKINPRIRMPPPQHPPASLQLPPKKCLKMIEKNCLKLML